MAIQNSLQKSKGNQRLGITAYLTGDAVKNQINQVVGGKNGQRFISAIVSAVNTNPTLQECTNQSILSGALLGESLKLSPSPQLGHYYLVPFNDKNKGKVAQFQMGYKGYIQLAIRSGQYKKINVIAVKEGELEYFDPLNEEIKINMMIDKWDEREAAPTIGYYARDDVHVEVAVVEKLAPQAPMTTSFAIGKDLNTGEMYAEEYGKQIKGQMKLDDYSHEQVVDGKTIDTDTGEIVKEPETVVDFRKAAQ